MTARNRFYQVPHCNGMGYHYQNEMAAMRGMKAEGGWAVVCTEQCDIHHSADIQPATNSHLWDDADSPYLAQMTEAVHRHGGLAGVQLVHNGFIAPNIYSREIPIGLTHRPVGGNNHPVQARAMDKTDIRNYRRWHRNAALRAKRTGFDIVCVYSGHDLNVPMHFLSRRHNERTDEYGGSLENRLRLFRELLEETKDAVGDVCGVVVRFAVDELLGSDGISCEGEGRDAVEMLAELPDLWGRQYQRLGQRLGDVAVQGRRLSGTVHRLRQAGHDQARCRRRPLHIARHDGLGDPSRRPRHDRRGAAVDRGSLPAQEDRGRPHR